MLLAHLRSCRSLAELPLGFVTHIIQNRSLSPLLSVLHQSTSANLAFASITPYLAFDSFSSSKASFVAPLFLSHSFTTHHNRLISSTTHYIPPTWRPPVKRPRTTWACSTLRSVSLEGVPTLRIFIVHLAS